MVMIASSEEEEEVRKVGMGRVPRLRDTLRHVGATEFFALRFEIWISNCRIFSKLFPMIQTTRKQVNGREGILASS